MGGLRRMTMRAELMAAIAISAFSGVFLFRGGFTGGEMLAIGGIGVVAILVFSMCVHGVFDKSSVGESLKAMVKNVIASRLGWLHAVGTVALMTLALSGGVMLGESRDEFWMSVMEGLRTGVFILMSMGVWRLEAHWRLACLIAWIALDVWAFAQVVIAGVGMPWVTFAAGALSGWLLLEAQGRLDRVLAPSGARAS